MTPRPKKVLRWLLTLSILAMPLRAAFADGAISPACGSAIDQGSEFLRKTAEILFYSVANLFHKNPMGGTGMTIHEEETAGKRLFMTRCSVCHALNGKGKPAFARMYKLDPSNLDLTKPGVRGESVDDISKLIVGGKGKMGPHRGRLNPDEVAAVAAYILEMPADP